MATIQIKICSSCKEEKPFEQFNKSKNEPHGLSRQCKSCKKNYRDKNKEHIKKKLKEYYEKNKDKVLEKNKIYREENVEAISIQRKGYREQNKEHIKKKLQEYLPIRKQKIKQRRKEDRNFRLQEIIRSKYHKMIKGINTSYADKIGCDSETLIKWLEFQFDENMNWNNLGDYWEIDHIIAINQFDFKDPDEIKTCYNWTNLQPLFKTENKSKSDNLELHYYFNSIINVHRFIQNNNSNFNGYQKINESLSWLREKLRYGNNPKDNKWIISSKTPKS
jgi:transposase-like protein